MLLGALMGLAKIIGILMGLAVLVIVGCAVALSGRISREEEKDAQYRELVRDLYLAQARPANDAEHHEEPAVRLVAP